MKHTQPTANALKADTYIPPVEVARNARLALEVRRTKPESQRGMTPVGIARAGQLANRRPVSLETIQRMVAYFDRHEIDKQGSTWDEQGKGWQAWMGWGGDAGRAWAREILQSTKETTMDNKSLDVFSPRQRALASALVEVAHESGKFDWGIGANGAHYTPAAKNPFIAENLRCAECVFYQPNNACAIVEGVIEEDAICKFWIIPEDELMKENTMSQKADIVMPTEDMPAENPQSTPEEIRKQKLMNIIDMLLEIAGVDLQVEHLMENEMTATEAAPAGPGHGNSVGDGGGVGNGTGGGSAKVDLTAEERNALPDEDFAIPSSRNFPINSPVAVSDAVAGWGRYEGPVSFETFKRNLIAIAKRKGADYVAALPQSWRDEMDASVKAFARNLLQRLG